MTRKDYVAIATALVRARAACETQNQRRGVAHAVATIADALAADNARFDRSRFARAAEGAAIDDTLEGVGG
jgi:hypothetical protein